MLAFLLSMNPFLFLLFVLFHALDLSFVVFSRLVLCFFLSSGLLRLMFFRLFVFLRNLNLLSPIHVGHPNIRDLQPFQTVLDNISMQHMQAETTALALDASQNASCEANNADMHIQGPSDSIQLERGGSPFEATSPEVKLICVPHAKHILSCCAPLKSEDLPCD